MKRSVFGLFLLCSDGKPNTDTRLEDNADAKLWKSVTLPDERAARMNERALASPAHCSSVAFTFY